MPESMVSLASNLIASEVPFMTSRDTAWFLQYPVVRHLLLSDGPILLESKLTALSILSGLLASQAQLLHHTEPP